jgi:serine/threonine-protein kinase
LEILVGKVRGMTLSVKTVARPNFAQVVPNRGADAILPGDSPPGWQLTRTLGGGSYCEVYRARPEHCPGKQLADFVVKLAKRRSLSTSLAHELLRREAKVLRACHSHHVVPLLAASFADDAPFLVMPFLPGITLAKLRQSGGQPTLPICLWIARQIAMGLEALAKVGWTHGDVKPENVILGGNGHVTLIDLGFAQPIHSPTDTTAQTLPLVGTPHYLAPERLVAGNAPTASSDVFSLGVVLFELLTNQLPYQATTAAELLKQHQSQKLPDVRATNPQVPLRLARLVRGMLANIPQRRPTPSELVSQLSSLEIELFAERLVGDWTAVA